jgi:hypothetical protein
MKTKKLQRLYSTGDVCRAANITPPAVQKARRAGRIEAYGITLKGYVIYQEAEARRFVEAQIARKLKNDSQTA